MTTIEFSVEWCDLTLCGSVHLPATDEPAPLVLMLQGSGPADRDSDGYFAPIREAFLRVGVATAAFDKPGCGASTGDWRRFGLRDRADQASAVLAVLRTMRDVDPDRVGLWGQSQGGWLVQLLAGERDDLGFAIANSGPSLTIPEQIRYDCEQRLLADPASAPHVDEALAFLSDAQQAASAGRAFADVEAELLKPARTKGWYAHLQVDDAEEWASVVAFANDDYRPVESLATVSAPFLAIFGGRDVLLPAWQGAREVGTALAASPCRDATVVVFPEADHRIRVDGEFATGYLDLLGDWIAPRLTRAG